MHTTSTDVRDGILFLGGLALLIATIIFLTNLTQAEDAFCFKIRFATVQSILSGVKVVVSGMPVGQVTRVSLQPGTNRLLVTVKVSRHVALYANDRYTIVTGGLMNDNYISITPSQNGGARVGSGTIVMGESSPEVNDLIVATSHLLTKLDTTTTALNAFLGDTEVRQKSRQAVIDLARTAATSAELTSNLNSQLRENRTDLRAAVADLRTTTHASSELVAGMGALLRRNQDDLDATVDGLRQTTASSAALTAEMSQLVHRNANAVDAMMADLGGVAKDLRQISATLSPQLTSANLVRNLDAASAHIVTITQRLESAAVAADQMLNDKILADSLRASATHLRQATLQLDQVMTDTRSAAASLPRLATDLEVVSGNLKDTTGNLKSASSDLMQITRPFREVSPEAAQNVVTITRTLRQTSTEVSGAIGKLSRMSAALSHIRVEPEVRGMALPDSRPKARADAHLTLSGPTTQLRLGVANLGHGNQVNAQLGHTFGPHLWLRGGLVQSELGMGVTYLPSPALRFSGDLFDPTSARANLQADVRLPGTRDAWWLSAGWYDLMDARHSAGIGLLYRPSAPSTTPTHP